MTAKAEAAVMAEMADAATADRVALVVLTIVGVALVVDATPEADRHDLAAGEKADRRDHRSRQSIETLCSPPSSQRSSPSPSSCFVAASRQCARPSTRRAERLVLLGSHLSLVRRS